MFTPWSTFFSDEGRRYLRRSIELALDEDGPDLTAQGLFAADAPMHAVIRAKEDTHVAPSVRFLPEAKITAYSPGASVSDGIFHSSGTSGSSERYQPARSTLVSPRFAISIQSERSPSLSASVSFYR